MLTAERLRELLTYDPETGVFRWRVGGKKSRSGAEAGCVNKDGHITITPVRGCSYGAHRLAWLYVTGSWPACQVDHINGIRNDNRFANLREATRSENSCNRKRHKNNRSGFKGVMWSGGRWQAQIMRDRKRISLGSFSTPEEAHGAYVAAAQDLHGKFARSE